MNNTDPLYPSLARCQAARRERANRPPSIIGHLGSVLQGYPNACMTPGLEACTGSLGQGPSFGNGAALAARLRRLDIRVYCLLGDGELHEGQVWEAVMGSSTHELDYLCALVDGNHLKSRGVVDKVCHVVPGRAYDQIGLQLSYARENAKIVGVSTGLTQGPDGATHQSLRALSGTEVVAATW